MMKIEKYGVVLSRLALKDIEMVRQYRNSEKIRSKMHFQEEITPDMQLKWFKSINNLNNFYFIIEVGNEKIGLIHGKKIDNIDSKKTTEGGIFIWNEKYHQGNIAAICSIIMADFTFYILNYELVVAKVLKQNLSMLSYNRKMGFVDFDEEENVLWMKMSKDKYEKEILKIRKGLGIIYGDIKPLSPSNIFIDQNFITQFNLEKKDVQIEYQEVLNKMNRI